MIGLIFATFHFCIALILVGSYFGILPWRPIIMGAVCLFFWAIIFNDRFLSFIDILAASYMILSLFIGGGSLTWVFVGYFMYKALVSL